MGTESARLAQGVEIERKRLLRAEIADSVLTDREVAQDMLASCDPIDVVSMMVYTLSGLGWDMPDFEMGFEAIARNVFAVRDVPASIEAWLDDKVRDASDKERAGL